MNELKQRILETTGDIAEFSIDILTKNEIVKEFPIVGTAIKIGLAVKSLSDRIFLAKLEKFILRFKEQKQLEKNKLISEIELSLEDRIIIGENLLLLIDRFSDMDKPELLALIFHSFLQQKISKEDFIRIGNSIDMAYSPDLMNFIKDSNDQENQRRLIRVGFTEYHKYGVIAKLPGSSEVTFWPIRITDVGERFLKSVKSMW